MFNFMYMSILSKLLIMHIHPLSHVLSCIYICGLVYIWICMYTLVCIRRHTYALKIKSFWWFSCFKEYWAYCLLFMIMCFTYILFTHLTYCLLMFYFHESYSCFIDFECWISCEFHVSWKIFLFYSLLEGFRTSLQIFSLN